MGWVRYTHAKVSATRPEALGACDRCGFDYNLRDLTWQYQWQGPKLQNLRILVCHTCLDTPQEQLRTIIIPPDPIPVLNPRQDPYMFMGQSSSPDSYQSGQPNVIATESTAVSTSLTHDLRYSNPITTESTIPLITNINVTPTPTSSGYTDNEP